LWKKNLKKIKTKITKNYFDTVAIKDISCKSPKNQVEIMENILALVNKKLLKRSNG